MLLSAARENTNNVKNYVKPPPKPDDEGYKAALEDIQNKLVSYLSFSLRIIFSFRFIDVIFMNIKKIN
jgi:hypothetical protein